MNDKSSNVRPSLSVGSILIGVGTILIGLAGLMIAGQWQTYTRISLESPPVLKNGFALITEKETESQFKPAKYHYYLLDKDSGRIWAKNEYKDSWQEVYIESITPSASPASTRK